MRAIHQFDLPEDSVEYMCHCKAADMALVLWKLQYEFWDKYKNGTSTVENIINDFNELMEAHDINIDRLTE